MRIAIIVGLWVVMSIPFAIALGRIVRAGNRHLDEPLGPESLRGGRPFGGPL